LFSVILGFWNVNFTVFNGDAIKELAAQFLSLAKKKRTKAPLMIGHRLMGSSLLFTGDIVGGRAHYDQALALYDPDEHRSLATQFGVDNRVTALNFRPLALHLLGYPDTALAEVEHGICIAREIGHATSLLHALSNTVPTLILCGGYATASAQLDELICLADAKGALLWKGLGILGQGRVLAHTGKALDAVKMITSGLCALQSTGATLSPLSPWGLVDLVQAYAETWPIRSSLALDRRSDGGGGDQERAFVGGRA
jgi:hypothetical protein